jgi:SH3-like domain-containing protein
MLFRGRGYMHRSVLGVNGLAGGAQVHAAPDARAQRQRVPLDYSDFGGQLLGCKGDWLHLRIRDFSGWTRDACLNGVTTCV